jgi:hypothetical protein
MAARRFLYIIAGIIFLLLGVGIIWTLFPDTVMRWTFVPTISFSAPPTGGPDYRDPGAWLSRPGRPDDPANWLPPGVPGTAKTKAVMFFVPPTTYLSRAHWNAPIDDKEMDKRARIIVPTQVSAFTNVARIWAPRYRQATVGAFLTTKPDAAKALHLAYSDVERAFDAFLDQAPPDAPIILAGHSQGSYHLLRLLKEKVAGNKKLKHRILAVYAVGWPISVTADLPALGLPACTKPEEHGCILSWESFAEPADPAQLRVRYDAGIGFTGQPRANTPALCVNPLTGTQNGAAPAAANLGALKPDEGYMAATLVPHLVPARCDPAGLLLIGPPPDGFGVAVLPGNNFHVFDYALFWSNVRADAARRLAAMEKHRR